MNTSKFDMTKPLSILFRFLFLIALLSFFTCFPTIRVGIEYTQGQEQNAYLAATYVKKEEPKEEKKVPAPVPEVSDSDSDSN